MLFCFEKAVPVPLNDNKTDRRTAMYLQQNLHQENLTYDQRLFNFCIHIDKTKIKQIRMCVCVAGGGGGGGYKYTRKSFCLWMIYKYSMQ